MLSLKTRAAWGMAITLPCLVAGIALVCSGPASLDAAFNKSLAEIGKGSAEDRAAGMVIGLLPLMGGGALTILGLILFPLFLAIWIRNPPPGSKLGFRGWKTPDQMTESDVAQEKAWRAILWGYLPTQSWIMPLFTVGYRGLLSHTSITMKLLLLIITVCAVFYTLGIRLCHRRDPASVRAAPWSWKAALTLNYGGLLGFLGLIGSLFFLRLRP